MRTPPGVRRGIAGALVAAAAASALACRSREAPAAPAGALAAGTWGGENVGVIVTDSVVHVHVGCTYGDFPAPVRADGAGRVLATGSWVLRAFPIAVGPSNPARLAGTVAGGTLTFTVTVTDTVAHTTVELGPGTVTLGREPRMGPCPICRVPRAFAKRLVRIL